MVMKNLYKYQFYVGPVVMEHGLFIATPEHVRNSIGKEAWFGGTSGRRSENYGTLTEDHIILISDDQEKVKWLFDVTGGVLSICGFNPLQYMKHEISDIDGYMDWFPKDEDSEK
jgi:hypothetical protein